MGPYSHHTSDAGRAAIELCLNHIINPSFHNHNRSSTINCLHFQLQGKAHDILMIYEAVDLSSNHININLSPKVLLLELTSTFLHNSAR